MEWLSGKVNIKPNTGSQYILDKVRHLVLLLSPLLSVYSTVGFLGSVLLPNSDMVSKCGLSHFVKGHCLRL